VCTQTNIVVGGTDSFMTVRHLVIRGTNFEIGRALGELAVGTIPFTGNACVGSRRHSASMRKTTATT
jgi:hypothetical protein